MVYCSQGQEVSTIGSYFYFVIIIIITGRWDTSITLPDCKAMSRSLSVIKDCAKKSDKECMGCKNQPLFEIELDHIVVDELHLLLRISYRLIDALVTRMAQLDHSCRVHGTGPPHHMNKLVTAIRSCGISFEVGLYIIIINSDNFHAMHRSGTS